MKLITAYIRPIVQDEVVERLQTMEVPGGSLSEVDGFGREADPEGGESYGPHVSPYQRIVKLEVFCREERVQEIAEAIAETAQTGRRGDGKVFVLPVSEAIDIRTQETGEDVV
jgi:nitrogen regulatory protein PII